MPQHTPEKIISMVDLMEKDRSSIHTRMDEDMDRYISKPYLGDFDENGEPLMEDFKKVTSNDPRNYANLAIHLIRTAKRIVVAPQGQAWKPERQIKNMKELFILGSFSSVDERRNNLMMGPLQPTIGAQCVLRGRWAQRAVIVKEEVDPTPEQLEERRQFEELGLAEFLPDVPTTRSYEDVTDWDPRNTYWGMGKHGLTWACHKQMKSEDEISEEYPDVKITTNAGDSDKTHPVYEFFDEKETLVIIGNSDRLGKKRTSHGMSRVPVSIGMVGSLPLMQADGEDYEEHYGESIFASNREIFNLTNFLLSYQAELCKRALNPATVVESEDGNKSLDENPNLSGSMISIKSQGREGINTLPQQEMIQTGAALLGAAQGMQQRGGYTSANFGQQAFELSGFAITQLRQGQELTTGAPVDGTRRALEDIANILADGYATGNFDTMTLAGRMQDVPRTYFSEEITAEVVAQGGKIEIRLEPQLPSDDAAKVALAQLMRDGDVPLADDRYIRENTLMMQNPDEIESAIFQQMAKRGSPVALAFSSMLSAEEQGDQELAKLWETEFQILLLQKFVELTQTQMVAGAGGQPNGPGRPNGNGSSRLGSNILPPAVQGIPPPTPTPQAGPVAAPGTPRPSGGNDSIGLGGQIF